jgi:hypothetical protein
LLPPDEVAMRLIACVVGSLVTSAPVERGLTSAGANGLRAPSSAISGLSVEPQYVQFQS